MKKALITGIRGFTGCHLAKFLSDHELSIYGIDSSSATEGDEYYLEKVADIFTVDVRDESAVKKVIHSVKPDFLFHLAGVIRNNDLQELFEVNVMGTKNVLECCRHFETPILIPGSAAEYGLLTNSELPATEKASLHPIDQYGLSKVSQIFLGYQYFLKYNHPIYFARPFNITGPGEDSHLVISSIAKQIMKAPNSSKKCSIVLGNITTKRDFIDVRDTIKAYWLLANKGIPGEIYNVCTGEAHSIKEIVNIFSNITGITIEVHQDSRYVKETDVPISVGSNAKIRKQTGWRPNIDLETTLHDILKYYQECNTN